MVHQIQGWWYFLDEDGESIGPYCTRLDAEIALAAWFWGIARD